MRRLALSLAMTAVLGLTACSGGSSGKSPAASAPTTAPAGSASSTVDTAFTGQGSTQFCTLLRALNDNTDRVAPSLTDPNALRQALLNVQIGIRQASSLAPAEIRPDIDLLSGVYADVVAALEQVNFDFTKISPAALSRLSAPEMQTAATRVQAYSANVCKVPG